MQPLPYTVMKTQRANPRLRRQLLFAAAALMVAPMIQAQNILNTNLIVNGGAEAGPAATSSGVPVSNIPGWTATTSIGASILTPTVLPYGLRSTLLQTSNPAPSDHGFNYFATTGSGGTPSTLTQNIDVSSAASLIAAGNLKYTFSAYLGSTNGGGGSAQAQITFKNANGQTFSSFPLGPLTFNGNGADGSGISLQQRIGLVPVGTTTVTITLGLTATYCGPNDPDCGSGAADNLSLILTTLGTDPASVLGANLLANGNAEMGSGVALPSIAPNVPGWSTANGASLAPYGGTNWVSSSDPGPSDRGVNLFCGGLAGATMYQDVDVSAAASLIDANKISYQVSAWLGSASNFDPTLTFTFVDWSGKQLAATGQLNPASISGRGLVESSMSGSLPAGTRRVRISLAFPIADAVADNISFIIGNAAGPWVTPSGVVPLFSSATTIESGSWVSIYGTGLAASTASWNGDFPTTLNGTSVTIDSNPAYLWFVSPTQINLQVPNDTSTGTVTVVVTTAVGSYTTDVTLGEYAPSFSVLNGKYVVATVPTVGPGNSGEGFDYIGPTGAFSFPSRPVKAGETVVLYGVGFGPTTPTVLAGAPFSGAATCVTTPTVTIGGVPAKVSFAGIVGAGLYQLNVAVPSAGSGDKILEATVGGMSTPRGIYLTLQ